MQDPEGLAEARRTLFNEAMLFERDRFSEASPYERRDYANGFRSKRLRTRIGELDLHISQIRNSDFYLYSLELGPRSELALKLSLSIIYAQGVSGRKVKAITEQSCSFAVTCYQVSGANSELREYFKQWRR